MHRQSISSFAYIGALITTLLLGCEGGQLPTDIQEEDSSLHYGEIKKWIQIFKGGKLFADAEFGGNGRTCKTCHDLRSGTVTLEEIQEAFEDDPNDPLFRALDSDDGTGASYERMLSNSTFRVTIPLPPNARLADDPDATTVNLFRTTLSNNNIVFESELMWDGRAPSLPDQALDAYNVHAEITETPSDKDLENIAIFQEETFFSSFDLWFFANGGPVPELPSGNTPEEIRGREFFIAKPFTPNCAFCHSGPLLNEGTPFGFPVPPAPITPGQRFFNTLVSTVNRAGLPVRTYDVTLPDGSVTQMSSSDPGRFLITGEVADFGRFKAPSIWNASETAPYFHDGSAKNLNDLMAHYQFMFTALASPTGEPFFSDQDIADIIAYLKLL